MNSVSIIVGTYNRKNILERALKAMLKQNYRGNYEIILVDDGSKDGTKEMAQERYVKNKKIRFFPERHMGPIKVRNFGIRKARKKIVVIMDDDCIPEKNWLKELVGGFSKEFFAVSSFSPDGGTSTAFFRKDMVAAGLFDVRFNRFPYREDTDLKFALEKLTGKKFKFIKGKAKFLHVHKQPETLRGKIKYGLYRLRVHSNDVLLFKKHPKKTKKMLDVKLGFIISPTRDFKIATGLWSPQKKFSFSSPQGVKIIENKTIIHSLAILLLGASYVVAVKIVRLYGSICWGKLLI